MTKQNLQFGIPLPAFLSADAFGYVRVAGHRIGLDQLVYYYTQGYSAEMLACEFPTLPLSLIYHCFAFYLDHRAEVDRYVAECRAASDERRRASRGGPSLQQLRDRVAAMHTVEQK